MSLAAWWCLSGGYPTNQPIAIDRAPSVPYNTTSRLQTGLWRKLAGLLLAGLQYLPLAVPVNIILQ